MHRGCAVIMLSTRIVENREMKPQLTGSIYLYPEDVEQLWEELSEKADLAYPIETFEYGMREFGIRDNNGYLLQFGQGIEEINR